MRGKALERALVAQKVFEWDLDARVRKVNEQVSRNKLSLTVVNRYWVS